MKRTLYTTTEYLHHIKQQISKCISDHIECDGGRWAMFKTKGAAKYDAEWVREKFPKSAKSFDGPKIVKITFEVLEK